MITNSIDDLIIMMKLIYNGENDKDYDTILLILMDN